MSKIILEKNNETIYFDFEEMECPVEAVHILATALVHLVKEYETAKNKEDFIRILGMYYDDNKGIKNE